MPVLVRNGLRPWCTSCVQFRQAWNQHISICAQLSWKFLNDLSLSPETFEQRWLRRLKAILGPQSTDDSYLFGSVTTEAVSFSQLFQVWELTETCMVGLLATEEIFKSASSILVPGLPPSRTKKTGNGWQHSIFPDVIAQIHSSLMVQKENEGVQERGDCFTSCNKLQPRSQLVMAF